MRIWITFAITLLLLSVNVLADVSTNKQVYKPGETVRITLSHTSQLSTIEVYVTKPDGKTEPKFSMKSTGSNLWEHNYTLKPASPNGTYAIDVKASPGGEMVDATMPVLMFSKSFDVYAWGVQASLDTYSLNPKDRLNLTVFVTEKYSEKLSLLITYEITDPKDNKIISRNITIAGDSKGFVDFYDIPENYTLGDSKIIINFTDSEGRFSNKTLEFYVSKPFNLSVSAIDETLGGELFQKTISFSNNGERDLNIEKMEVSESLRGIIAIIKRPYVILSGGTGSMEIEINTKGLPTGVYSGSIDVFSKGINNAIPIRLNVVSSEMPAEDNSYIIWYFTIGIVTAIAIITVVRYRKLKKKEEEAKKARPQQKKRDFFAEPKEQYGTEYY